MGGYALYIWSSYGLALLVLAINLILPLRRKNQVLQDLARMRRQEARRQNGRTGYRQGEEANAGDLSNPHPNGHGARAVPDHETTARHDRSPHPSPLPKGEGDQCCRDFHGNSSPAGEGLNTAGGNPA